MRRIDGLPVPVYDSLALAVSAIAGLARRHATRDEMPMAHRCDGQAVAA